MYYLSESSDSDDSVEMPRKKDKGVDKFLEKNKRKYKKKDDFIPSQMPTKMDKGFSQAHQNLQAALMALNRGLQNPQMLSTSAQEAITQINAALSSMRVYDKGCAGCVSPPMSTPSLGYPAPPMFNPMMGGPSPLMGGQMPLVGGPGYAGPSMLPQMGTPSSYMPTSYMGTPVYGVPSTPGFVPASDVVSSAMRK